MSTKPGAKSAPYNPLAKRNLAESIERAILRQEPSPLPPSASFPGTGLYLLYYTGAHKLYAPLVAKNAEGKLHAPIYVGKAVRAGSRSKLVDFDEPESVAPDLYKRLLEHVESIKAAANLRIEDFRCRYLVIDEVFIPLGEALVIQHYRPLWNHAVKGFGLHDPGSGRTPKRSDWDTLHPGREKNWRSKLKDGKTPTQIEDRLKKFYSSKVFREL